MGVSALLSQADQHEEALQVLEEGFSRLPYSGQIARMLAHTLAASPLLDQRDGERALDLALKVYRARPSPENARIVAMAHAEKNECDAAVEWQEQAVQSAADLPERTLDMEALKRNLEHYRRERPCRAPAHALPPATAPSGDDPRQD
jgi:hypothetical protein